MQNELCERFGIEFPIFAFTHCRDVAAAVSRAGGLGVLGALAFPPDQLELELQWIDEHVDGKPYGVDIVMPVKTADREAGLDSESGLVDSLRGMIDQKHWDFVDEILAEHGAGDLPAAERHLPRRRRAREGVRWPTLRRYRPRARRPPAARAGRPACGSR